MTVTRRVSWNDCDPSGLIRYQAAFDWFVDAEVEFLRSRGLQHLFERMPRVAARSEYVVPLRYDDLVEIEVSVAEIGRSSVTYDFVARRDGRDAVTASVTCVHVADGRAASIPDDVRAALEGS
ncbi:MAG TPA: thioesterase family protein [Gaiellaceae bacterium]|nr:thioesterase family protein [Gaiellaceae bacterium]